MVKHLIAVAERSVATFIFAFVGIITASSLTNTAALKAAAIAGSLSVLKYLGTQAGIFLASSPSNADLAAQLAYGSALAQLTKVLDGQGGQAGQNESSKYPDPVPPAPEPVIIGDTAV